MPHFYLLVPRHEEDDLKGIALYKKCGFLIFTCALHGLPARKKVSLHFNCLEIFIIICTNLHNSGPSLSRRKKNSAFHSWILRAHCWEGKVNVRSGFPKCPSCLKARNKLRRWPHIVPGLLTVLLHPCTVSFRGHATTRNFLGQSSGRNGLAWPRYCKGDGGGD